MILITGATGFLGSNLTKKLLKDGYSIRIYDTNVTDAKKHFPKAEIMEGDIMNRSLLKAAMKNVSTVIHLAGLVSYTAPESELFRINVYGTKNVIDSAVNAKRVLFASSVSVMGRVDQMVNENYIGKPVNPYGRSKLVAENLIRDSGIDGVSLRMAPLYGAGSYFWIRAMKTVENGFPVPNVPNLIHLLHVRNAVQAFEKSLKKGSGIYLVADADPIKFTDFTGIIAKAFGMKQRLWPPWIVFSLAKLKGIGKELEAFTIPRQYDISKARKELGYKPNQDTEKEIMSMIDWYKEISVKV